MNYLYIYNDNQFAHLIANHLFTYRAITKNIERNKIHTKIQDNVIQFLD